MASLSDANVIKLEWVQYALVLVVTGIPANSHDHMKPLLAKLHWLPIRERVTVQIAMNVFKIHQTRHTSYLAELIENHVPSHVLQSTTCQQSVLKEFRITSVTDVRTFCHMAAKTWNCAQLCRTILDLSVLSDHSELS